MSRSISLLLIVWVGLLCMDCTPPTLSKSNAERMLPEHLSRVWLPHNSTITQAGYLHNNNLSIERGIGATILGFAIDEPRTEAVTPIAQRVHLELDGQVVSKSTLRVEDGLGVLDIYDEAEGYLGKVYTGSFSVSWTPPLAVGTHSASLTVTSNTGGVFEYTWRFSIK
jgi:hypothetical protein